MKHQGYGKVVELPKVNGFMGRREKEGWVGKGKAKKGSGSGCRVLSVSYHK